MKNRTLTNYEKRIVEAVAGVIIPNPYGPFTKSVSDVDIGSKVSEALSYLSIDARLSYRLFLIIIEFGGLFYRFRFTRFSKMSDDEKANFLNAWHGTFLSPKRAVARFVEAIININYYSVPEVAAECGYLPKFTKASSNPVLPEGRICKAPLEGENEISADVCVIGSGAGGSAVAKELAELGRSVVILEEGGYHTVAEYGADAETMTKRLYRDGGFLASFGWPNILIPLGCCVGGTTVINSGTCLRAPDHVLNRWVHEFGLSGWSPEKMRSLFDRVEQILEVSTAPDDLQSRNTEVFKRGLEKLSLKGSPVRRNAPGCTGSGVCCFGCPTNAKKSADLNFIPAALNAGATLYTHCRANKIIYDGDRARSVSATFHHPETKKRTGKLKVNARVVVVACGTMHTPVLLKKSHTPDPGRSIGHNLTLHPASKVVALFDEEIKGWNGIPQGYGLEELAAEGIRLEQIFTPPAFVAPNLLVSGTEHSEVMANYNRLACFGLIVSDTSHGRVVGLTGNRLSIWYAVNKYDLPKYLRGIALLTEIFFAAGAKKVFPSLYRVPVITREEGSRKLYDVKMKAKDLDLQAFHPLGTCRMGNDPRRSALDQTGRIYSVDNVYVADGSIFPTSLGVNPQVTIMASALKVAHHIHHEVL